MKLDKYRFVLSVIRKNYKNTRQYEIKFCANSTLFHNILPWLIKFFACSLKEVSKIFN